MIKQLLIILCAFAFCATANVARGQIQVGAKTGVNLNQFRQPGTTMGVNLGVYGSYPLTPFLTVRFEPQYSLEGGARPDYARNVSQFDNGITQISYINPSVRFHNIQLPILAEVTLPELADQTIAPYLIAGASYALTMSSVEQHLKRYDFIPEVTNNTVYIPASMDVAYQSDVVTKNYSRNQWNLWLGMGVKFKTGERTFAFDVRYRHGLNNLNRYRFASPGNGVDFGIPGTGGKLFSSTLSLNFSMSIFNF